MTQRTTVSMLVFVFVGALAMAQEQSTPSKADSPVKTMDYVARVGDQVELVSKGERTPLKQELKLSGGLTVTTNGVIKVTGSPDEKLLEGRKLTLDGFWLRDDGMLLQFGPHYFFSRRVLYLARRGAFDKVDQNVTFENGIVLNTDETLLTPSGKLIRLQDGQGLTADGKPLHALDHVMMIEGKLVLQKDGAFVNLPSGSVISMQDGTKVTSGGLVSSPGAQSIQLQDGQRLTMDGPAMPELR